MLRVEVEPQVDPVQAAVVLNQEMLAVPVHQMSQTAASPEVMAEIVPS
jgi:hypothetical protein